MTPQELGNLTRLVNRAYQALVDAQAYLDSAAKRNTTPGLGYYQSFTEHRATAECLQRSRVLASEVLSSLGPFLPTTKEDG